MLDDVLPNRLARLPVPQHQHIQSSSLHPLPDSASWDRCTSSSRGSPGRRTAARLESSQSDRIRVHPDVPWQGAVPHKGLVPPRQVHQVHVWACAELVKGRCPAVEEDHVVLLDHAVTVTAQPAGAAMLIICFQVVIANKTSITREETSAGPCHKVQTYSDIWNPEQ
jgi:hypothetical protein